MTKTIKKLEKENAELRRKCSSTDVTLIEMANEKAALAKQLETTTKGKTAMEGLCRTLQEQVKEARQRASDLERGAEQTPPPKEPVEPAAEA